MCPGAEVRGAGRASAEDLRRHIRDPVGAPEGSRRHARRRLDRDQHDLADRGHPRVLRSGRSGTDRQPRHTVGPPVGVQQSVISVQCRADTDGPRDEVRAARSQLPPAEHANELTRIHSAFGVASRCGRPLWMARVLDYPERARTKGSPARRARGLLWPATEAHVIPDPPSARLAHIGGSGTWAFPYPDGALEGHPYLSVDVVQPDIQVA